MDRGRQPRYIAVPFLEEFVRILSALIPIALSTFAFAEQKNIHRTDLRPGTQTSGSQEIDVLKGLGFSSLYQFPERLFSRTLHVV